MARSANVIVMLAACALHGGLAHAQSDEALRRYELPNLDALELALPPGWQDQVDQPPGGGPPAILLTPTAGVPFEVHLTPEWAQPATGDPPDAEILREAVRAAAERIRPQVIETEFEIRRLQGTSGVGFYFRATDSAPQDGGFRNMNEGALQVGQLTLWFMILTNDGQEEVVAQALALLRGAVHRATGLDQR